MTGTARRAGRQELPGAAQERRDLEVVGVVRGAADADRLRGAEATVAIAVAVLASQRRRRVGHADIAHLAALPLQLLEEVARGAGAGIGARPGSRPARCVRTLAVEARGDDRDRDLVAEPLVE